MPTIISSASRVARSKFVALFGQSLCLLYTQSGSWAQVVAEVTARTANTSVMPYNGALSGRYSSKSFAVADGNAGSTAYWWDDVGNAAGSILTSALSDIAAQPQLPDALIWNQGEADTVAFAGLLTGITAAQAWTTRRASLASIFAALRTQVGSNIPVIIDMPSRSTAARYRGMELRRQCDLHTIRAGTAIYRGVEQYDASLHDSTHPNHASSREIGRRQGHNLAALWGASSYYRGPSVASVTKVSATRTDVAITLESGDTLVKPGQVPQHWRVESDTAYGTALAISGLVWSGNTAQLTHASCAGNPVFFPAYDECLTYRAIDWCGGSVSGMPLRSYDLRWTTAH